MIKMKYSLAITSLLFLNLISPIFAHTWVETVNLIGSDGGFQNTGFPRGFGGREAGVDPDKTNTYLLPPNGRGAGNEILPTDLICKDTQVNQIQSAGHPRLSASPKDYVSLAYHENGHVTKFATTDGKPEGRGTVFIYGTNNPSPKDTFLGIHRIWNVDGTGGDKRGKLLATRPFDDGRCYQPNSENTAQTRAKALGFASAAESPEVLCQAIVQLPSDAGNNGTYTLYWVWDWPTLDKGGNIFKNESYTTCIDIDMQSKSVPKASQPIGAKKVSKDQGDKACVQSDKMIQVNCNKAVANKDSESEISQEKVTKDKFFTKKEALDNTTKKIEFKGAEATDKSSSTQFKANRKDSVKSESSNGSKLDEGKAFSATGVMTTKGGKDKANTIAVKDQLEGESQIMIDPEASPKIASDNPPKNPGSTISSSKGNKNSTKIATPLDQMAQKIKGKTVSSEDKVEKEDEEQKEDEEEKGNEEETEDDEEDDEDNEDSPSNSLPSFDSTNKGNKNLAENLNSLDEVQQKVKAKISTSEGDEDLPSNLLSISDKNFTENTTPIDEVDKKETEKMSTSEEKENVPSYALPISRVMRNKVYIFAGNNSNVDLVRTITLPK